VSGVLYPDLARSFALGSQLRVQQEERGIDKEVNELVPAAMKGDQAAIENIARKRPNVAIGITGMLDKMDAGRRAKVKEASEWTAKAAMGILSLPEAERPAAYQAALSEGQRLGYQIDMPPQYDRAVEGRLNQVINQARPIADYFKGRDEGFDLVPSGGGGGAPATGDMLSRTKQVIGGMESSNRYDAVGPDTGGGKKALGKYQVMDFNVGPWTQEALGRALTPEQFLASPQAQEAVADFKLGQYIKQFGSPEAAARAWFAGAGGMNNAGAKDVLGTSVQGYGQKFAQAFGPGATGDAPPGIAQGDTAPPADASGTPIPTSDGGSVPREAMRMITPNLPPGTSLGRDRKTGLFKVQEGNFVIYDSNRNPVGLIPIPKPKEQGTGPFTGNSVEAQALNMLIANGTLTPQQAAELAAGKTVTDPETKQTIFMTPSGIFGQTPGQAPRPIAGPAPGVAAPQGGAPLPPAGGPAGVAAPAAPAAAPANSGAIPLTGTKTTGQPSAAEMANLRSARVELEKITAAAEDFKKEWSKATPVERARTLSGAPTPLASSYYNFALLAKGDVLYKLGVLNGPDLTIIQKSLPDPSTWSSVMANDNDVIGAVDKALNLVKIGVSGTERQFGIAPPQQGAAPAKTAKGTYTRPRQQPDKLAGDRGHRQEPRHRAPMR